MTTLKPCPFCGGEAYITNFDVFGGVRYVVCKGCGGRIQMPSEAEAITAWNNRTEPDNHSPTNADGFRSMSDKELAEYIFDLGKSDKELAEYIFDLGNGSEYCYGHCAYQDDCATKGLDHDTCIKGVIDWLKQPAKEKHK